MEGVHNMSGSGRRMGGLAFVVVLHAVLAYFLVTGLASKVVQAIQKPLETKIVEEKKPPPVEPPKQIALPPPPKVAVPPPFIPPPEISVPTRTTESPIAVTRAEPAPAAEPQPQTQAVAQPAKATAPERMSAGVVCPNSSQVRAEIQYPPSALKNNITGEVLVEFVVGTDAAIKDIQVVKSAHTSLDKAALAAVRKFSCVAQGRDVRVQVPFSFKLN